MADFGGTIEGDALRGGEADRAREVTRAVFEHYERAGQENYFGECVTQAEHAIQCALAAQREGSPTQVVLGAFLHDLGHLLTSDSDDVTSLGAANHDVLGADYLHSLGVPDDVTCIARSHVNAKRYLCHKQPGYHDKLSEASKQTLLLQGGVMASSEADEFEKTPHLSTILCGRVWDEQAKVANMPDMPDISEYRDMFYNYMLSVLRAHAAQ